MLELPDVEPSTAAAVRSQMLPGLTTVAVLAEAIGKSERTIYQYISQGMAPAMSAERRIPLTFAQVRDWLMARSRSQSTSLNLTT